MVRVRVRVYVLRLPFSFFFASCMGSERTVRRDRSELLLHRGSSTTCALLGVLKHIFRRRREPRYSSSLLVGYARLFLPPHRKLARLVRALLLLLLLLHAFSFCCGWDLIVLSHLRKRARLLGSLHVARFFTRCRNY